MEVIYTAVVLDTEDQEALKDYVPRTEGWKTFCHHRTLKFGKQDLPDNLGERVTLTLGSIYVSGDVVCVATTDGGHITIATRNGQRPVASNDVVGKSEYFATKQCYLGRKNGTTVNGTVMAFVADNGKTKWL